jgi:hypothetical protein
MLAHLNINSDSVIAQPFLFDFIDDPMQKESGVWFQ